MKTKAFLELLNQHQEKSLLFEYQPNTFVGANYHITEVKHVTIDAVDCGANTDDWKETVIQLWESPLELDKLEFMNASKALSILNLVAKMKPYTLDAEVKIEYSNATFHTAQLFVSDFEIRDHNLIVKLDLEKTDCKAKSLCGVEAGIEAVSKEEPCCSPTGNCC